MNNEPLKIGETITLENGDVIMCIEDNEVSISCRECYFRFNGCETRKLPLFSCSSMSRGYKENIHFELIKPK